MGFSLKELLLENSVKAKVQVTDRDEAIDYIGNLLIKTSSITESYISAMKKVFAELGPYAVIAPGIVLLHARPEDGVIHACLGLITLKTPIVFGHSQNDPVDIVIALGAKDKESHIKALAELANLLSNQQSLTKIRETSSSKDLYKVIILLTSQDSERN